MKFCALLLSICLTLASCGHGSSAPDGKLYVCYGMVLHNFHWMYLSGGKAYFGLGTAPQGGPENLDLAAYVAKHPESVADYKLTADKLILSYKDGKKEARSMTADPKGGMILNGEPYPLLLPLGDGAPLAGTFAWTVAVQGASAARTVTFDKAGKFTQRVVAGVSSRDGRIGGDSDTQGDGTYTVKGYTITLNHRDGQVERHSAGCLDAKVAYLYLDAGVMNREK